MSFNLKTTCDDCGCDMMVNEAAHNDPLCVIAWCNHCANEAPSLPEYYENSHHVVGIRVSPPDNPAPVRRSGATRCPDCFTPTDDGVFRCCRIGKMFNN